MALKKKKKKKNKRKELGKMRKIKDPEQNWWKRRKR